MREIRRGRTRDPRLPAQARLASPAVEPRRTDRLVRLVPAHLHLLSVEDALALGVVPDHHGRLLAATANGLHLLDRIGDGQELERPGKAHAAEIRAQPIADDRYAVLVGEAVKVPRPDGVEGYQPLVQAPPEARSDG